MVVVLVVVGSDKGRLACCTVLYIGEDGLLLLLRIRRQRIDRHANVIIISSCRVLVMPFGRGDIVAIGNISSDNQLLLLLLLLFQIFVAH